MPLSMKPGGKRLNRSSGSTVNESVVADVITRVPVTRTDCADARVPESLVEICGARADCASGDACASGEGCATTGMGFGDEPFSASWVG